jgi:hypothetical protein
MIRLLLIVLFIASIVMSNQSMAVVDDTPVFVNGGTLAISSIPATSGTASVSVTNFPATQNVSVTGVVTTTGTQAIAGVVTTAGTVTVANPVTSVTVSNFPASQITTVTNGTITVSNPTTSVVVSSLPAIAGTVVVSSSALPSGASTSAKQDTLLATEGSIANAVVNGTLVVTLGSRFTSQTFAAASQGTLSLELGKGISEITIDSYDPDACTGSFCAYTDKKFYFYGSLDGVNFRPISCSDSILLDEQIPIDSISGDGTNNGTGYFRCPVSGIETFRMIAAVATKRAALSIAASSGNTMVQQVQAIGYTKQYDWPNGSATTANSKSIIPATDSINFPVMVNGGTIACSNCSGASSGTTAVSTVQSGTLNVVTTVGSITNPVTVGTHAVTQSGTWTVGLTGGTVGISGPVSITGGTLGISGVVTTTGTLVQGAAGASPWLTTSLLGTLTKVATVDTITNAVTVNTHAVTQSGTWTVGLTGGTIGISGPVNTFGTTSITGGTVGIAGVVTTTGTMNITGGTIGISGVVTTTGTLVQGAAGLSPWLVTSTTGTMFTSQLSLSPISISFSESASAPTAATWFKRSQWQVPSGSTFLPDKAKSVVTTAGSRTLIGTGVVMGSLNLSTNTFTDSIAVSAPRFFSRMLGCVTTVMSAASDNITVTYTDDLGNSHSSVATTFAASSPVGNCFEIPLAATTGAMRDTGFRDVTNITDSAAPTGIIEIIGMNPLHDTLGAANAFEISTISNSVVLQNEFVWILEMQAATTAQQRSAAVEGAIRTP